MAIETMYVVSAGEYSDYSVLCVARTKQAAEAIVERVESDGESWYRAVRVEEMPMMEADDAYPREVLSMTVTLWDDGSETDRNTHFTMNWPFEWGYEPKVRWRWVRAPVHKGRGGRLNVRGADHEAVRKTFSDKRAQLKATPSMRQQKELKGRSNRNRAADRPTQEDGEPDG